MDDELCALCLRPVKANELFLVALVHVVESGEWTQENGHSKVDKGVQTKRVHLRHLRNDLVQTPAPGEIVVQVSPR